MFETYGPSHLIDLTHSLKEGIPKWEGDQEFKIRPVTSREDDFFMHEITTSAGIGTHLDAPFLMDKEGLSVDQIPLSSLLSNLFVITEGVKKFEEQYGEIEEGAFVIFKSGWYKKWDDKRGYEDLHFPTPSKEDIEILIERKVVGIGVDTLSPDSPESHFPNHHLLLKKGIYLVENLTNLEKLPPVGAQIALMPIKLSAVGEGPLRAIAIVSQLYAKEPLKIRVNEEIELRQLFPTEAKTIFKTVKQNQKSLVQFMSWAEMEPNIHSTRQFLYTQLRSMGSGSNLLFGIYVPQFVGQIEVRIDQVNRTGELGYWLNQEEEGKGITTQAAKALIDYSFQTLKLGKVTIVMGVDNIKSEKIAKRLGCEFEGIRRLGYYYRGGYHDVKSYYLLNQ